MKVVIHSNGSDHQRAHGELMATGLARHGINARHAAWNAPEPCDAAVVWGAKQDRVFAEAPHVLVMERGHIPDRMHYVSCGWDGLARRGRYPKARDGGERWRKRYGHLMQSWCPRSGYALIIGQVEGDAALKGLDVIAWAEQTARDLHALGWPVRFRPHPWGDRRPEPRGTTLTAFSSTLAQDLDDAGLCVTFNSTAGVEAVLAGVPTVTLDAGAMAWPVASHAVDEPAVYPNRDAWAWDLAWSQWAPEEIACGEAWAYLEPIMGLAA